MGGTCSTRGIDNRHIRNFGRKTKGRDYLGDVSVDGRIILKRSPRNSVWVSGRYSSGSGQGPVASSCEHSNEPLRSTVCLSSRTSSVMTTTLFCRFRVVLSQPLQEWRYVCVVTTRGVLLQVSTGPLNINSILISFQDVRKATFTLSQRL
jgi:hypothetical protein